MPILVFLGLSVFDLGGPDVRDRQTDVRETDRQTSDAHHRIMPPALWDVGIISKKMYTYYLQFCLDIAVSDCAVAMHSDSGKCWPRERANQAGISHSQV